MCLVFTYILRNSKSIYKYKDTAGSTPCPLPRGIWARGQPPGEKSCLCKWGVVIPLCECWPFSSLVCGQSLHLLLERGLFAQKGGPRSHTNSHCTGYIKQSQSLYKPQAQQGNSIMAITLPHQEGLINELQFQWPLKYTRLIIFHEMVMGFWLITGLRHNLLMSLKWFSPFNCFSYPSFPSFSTNGFRVD